MGCNPIYIKDVDGRDLKIGGDLSYSLTDIQSLVPKNYRAFVKVTGDGMIAFQSNKLPEKMQKYKSVVLLNNMINSENHYLYVAGDVMPATEKGTNRPIREFGIVNGVKLDFGTAIDNLSKTPRSDKPDEPLPAAGFDGALRISIGQFSGTSEMVSNFEVPRELVIFHELDENYLRTEEPGMDYGPAHKKAGTDGLQFRKDLNIDNFAPKGDISGGKFTPTPTSSPQSTPSQPTTQPVAPQKR
jgi:hypothetical protein